MKRAIGMKVKRIISKKKKKSYSDCIQVLFRSSSCLYEPIPKVAPLVTSVVFRFVLGHAQSSGFVAVANCLFTAAGVICNRKRKTSFTICLG